MHCFLSYGPFDIIARCNLDGSASESLANDIDDGINDPRDIALDVANNHMYWVERDGSQIMRADLNGGNITTINNSADPVGLALDLESNKIYWSGWDPSQTDRSNLDGTVIDVLLGNYVQHGIALDVPRGKLYFASGIPGDTPGQVYRANLNGTSLELLVNYADGSPYYIALK